MAEALLSADRLGPALSIILGIALLVFGRKLFWVFVGAVGFVAGLQWGSMVLGKQPELILLLFSVALGLLGALLAVFIQRIAVAVAGGIVGGLFALRLAEAAGFAGQTHHLIAFLVGALLAAVLVSLLFDWALVILSSLVGGSLLAQELIPQARLELIATLILCIIGIVVQTRRGVPRG